MPVPETVISFDGTWEHRRNSSSCLVTVIEQKAGRVMECVVIGRKVREGDPTFCLEPRKMEGIGLARVI